MTTILGIIAEYEKKGIVLFADTQVARGNDKYARPALKIYKPNDYFALAHTGRKYGGEDFRGFFGSNSRRSAERLLEHLENRYIPDYSDALSKVRLLIGMRINGLGLYDVDQSGNVVKVRRYRAYGSGSVYARRALQKDLNGNISLEKALKVGHHAELTAFQDMNTGGLFNFVVITEDGIDREGIQLTNKVLRIEKETIDEAINRHRAD